MTTPRFTTYDLDGMTFAFGGAILFDGFAEGEVCTLEFQDAFEAKVGADGKSTRAKKYNRSAKITMKLMASSACNDLLSAVLNADLLGRNGAGVGPFYIRDRSGRSVFATGSAWIVKFPSVSYGDTVGTREWVFDCDHMDAFVGGN